MTRAVRRAAGGLVGGVGRGLAVLGLVASSRYAGEADAYGLDASAGLADAATLICAAALGAEWLLGWVRRHDLADQRDHALADADEARAQAGRERQARTHCDRRLAAHLAPDATRVDQTATWPGGER